MIRTRKKVYISCPYQGDIDEIKRTAISIAQKELKNGNTPIVPVLIANRLKKPADQELIYSYGLQLLHMCDEVHLYDNIDTMRGGKFLRNELKYAIINDIPVVHIPWEE